MKYLKNQFLFLINIQLKQYQLFLLHEFEFDDESTNNIINGSDLSKL